jgi:hypothetical protein
VPTNAPEKIAVIQIDMTTDDSQGKVPNIPLTTKVRVRMDKGDDVYDITDYCMYGKAGVNIKNGATITTPDLANYPANIGSLTNLITEDQNVTVWGNIVAGGQLTLNNGSVSAQDVFVNNKKPDGSDYTTGYAIDIGNATIKGNANCNGNVHVGNGGIINGNVNLSPTGTINSAREVFRGGVSPLKFYNPLPDPTIYPDPDPAIYPTGKYPDISLGNGETLNLTSGVYYFNSFKYANNANININLSSDPGTIQIFVVGNISGKSPGSNANVTLTGGDPSKVFIESHGNVSWTGNMYGTVFAPLGNIEFYNYVLQGAIYSGGTLLLDHPNADIVYIPPDPSVRPPQFP